jgi:excisionase family DNA binding protein
LFRLFRLLSLWNMSTIRENINSKEAFRPKRVSKGTKASIKAAVEKAAKKPGIRREEQTGDFVNIKDPGTGHNYRIARHFLPQISAYLKQLETGKPALVISQQQTLTTQEAADLLNVSRPHVIKLTKEGALQYSMIGTHRRLFLENVLAFRDAMKNSRGNALQKLADDAQDLQLGY